MSQISFYKPSNVKDKPSNPKEILFNINNLNFDIKIINTLSAVELDSVKHFVIRLRKEILKLNKVEEKVAIDAEISFLAAVERLWSFENKFPAINFSCQLLQYYNLVTDSGFAQDFGVEDFSSFLHKNSEKFSNFDKNMFIMEHNLLKIDQELNQITNSFANEIATTDKINFILEQLNQSSESISQWKLNAPDNVFIHYLHCVHSYLVAKALEFKCAEGLLTDEECQYFRESSHSSLTAMTQCLDMINELNKIYGDRNKVAPGVEFSLGMDVLFKAPSADIKIHGLVI